MMMCLPMVLFVACAPLVAGHGTLTKPASRNLLVNMGLTHPGEGQCHLSLSNHMNMNGCQGGVGPIDLQGACWSKCVGVLSSTAEACVTCKREFVQTTEQRSGFQPEPRLGVCGDLQDRQSFSRPGNTDCDGSDCVTVALAKPLNEVKVHPADNSFEVQVHLTAHHWGWAEFRLCREGGRGANGLGLTQECFNQDVLKFDAADASARYATKMGGEIRDPSDYIGSNPSKRCDGPGAELKLETPQIWSPPGSCCYAGGDCGNSNTSKTQNVRFMFPGPQAGPVYTIRVVLPAGLSCTQAAPCALQWTYMTGNSWDSYPEVFRNCADFKLGVGDEGSTQAATPAATSPATPTPTVGSEPEPEPEPATPAPTTPAPATSSTVQAECDDGSEGSCKRQCQTKCNGLSGGVTTNQCWGSPRYIYCLCSDNSTHSFPGCSCMNSQCPTFAPTPGGSSAHAPTLAPNPAPTPAPTVALTPAPTTDVVDNGGSDGGVAGDSYHRTVWWPGCACDKSPDYSTQFKSKASCEAAECGSLAQVDSQAHQGQAEVRRHDFLSGSSMMSRWTEKENENQSLSENRDLQDEL